LDCEEEEGGERERNVERWESRGGVNSIDTCSVVGLDTIGDSLGAIVWSKDDLRRLFFRKPILLLKRKCSNSAFSGSNRLGSELLTTLVNEEYRIPFVFSGSKAATIESTSTRSC